MSNHKSPAHLNAFALFGIEPSFSVNLNTLESAYIALSAKWHPDQNPRASSREKLERTLKTAEINDAYDVLKDPLRRGYHLLSILAPDLNADREKTIRDPELLVEAMDDQEALDEMTTAAEVAAFIKHASGKANATLDKIQSAFDQQDFESAMRLLYRYRYYDKVQQDALVKQAKLVA